MFSAAPLWLAPIDITYQPTLWAWQDLQEWVYPPWQGFAQPGKWVTTAINAVEYPTRRWWRAKTAELTAWNPFREYPYQMNLPGYKARMFYWGRDGTSHLYRAVESSR